MEMEEETPKSSRNIWKITEKLSGDLTNKPPPIAIELTKNSMIHEKTKKKDQAASQLSHFIKKKST